MNEEERNKIIKFLEVYNLAVVSTVDVCGNKTQSAVVAFAESDSLELIFGTSSNTRKYKNLKNNPNVSFVIGWDTEIGTVQYEGVASELLGQEAEKFSKILVTKNPRSEKFLTRNDQRYFLVKPKWIRMLDMTVSPNQMIEINL